MPQYFIDVSEHDWSRRGGAPNWRQVIASGLDAAVIARASYGDPKGFSPATLHFGDYMKGAAAEGITPRGGYHNLIRGDNASIARQVDYLRREMDKYSVEFGMLDVEAYEELKTQNLTPRWSDVQRWNERWAQVETRVCAFYLARWVWNDYMGRPDLSVLQGPLFNASYAGGVGGAKQIYTAGGGDDHPGWEPYGERTPDVVQFTSSASVPGVTKANITATKAQTDCNAFRGSREQLHALLLNQPAGSTVEEDEDAMINPQAFHDLVWTVLGLVKGDADITIPQMDGGVPERTIPNGIAAGMAEQKAQVADLTRRLDDLATAGGSADSLPVIAAVRGESEKLLTAVGELGTKAQEQAARVAAALGGT